MQVEVGSGRVTLTNGFAFDATLTRPEFRAQGLHDPTRVTDPGTPWYYYPFTDGEVQGHPLNLSLCFYRDILVSLSFSVDHYTAGASSWDDFSYEVESEMQLCHAAMLRQWFGPPHGKKPSGVRLREYPALSTHLTYEFSWGSAWCGHDDKGGSTEGGLRYAVNDAWAHHDYAQEGKGTAPPFPIGPSPHAATSWLWRRLRKP